MAISRNLNRIYSTVTASSWKPLFEYINKKMPKDLMKSKAFLIMGANRLASWNFEHIAGPCGTIEFRRSPGCNSATKARHWVSFALGFLYQASKGGVNWATIAIKKTHPSVKDLEDFIASGIQALEPTCKGLKPTVENTDEPTVFTAAEVAKKISKLLKRKSPYVESISSLAIHLSL